MLIGVDAGTSVVKAVAFGDDGEALRVAAVLWEPVFLLRVEPNRTWKQ